MHKKILALLLLALFFNQGINAQDRDTLPAFITYSYIPVLKWNVTSGDHLFYPKGHMFYRELYLDYTFNQNALSSIEGNFGIKRIGLRMGVSVNMDNNLIGKVSKYGGYLGFKNFWLRLQTGNISGSVNWTGENVGGILTTCPFTGKYTNIELLKTSGIYKYMEGDVQQNRLWGFFYGFGYTTLPFPIEFEAKVKPVGSEYPLNGTPFYDPSFKTSCYTILVGYDMLRQFCLSGGRFGVVHSPASRFGIYSSNNMKVGLGSTTLSDVGVNNAHAQNPGYTLEETKSFMVWDGIIFTLGCRYYYANKKFFILAAVGYDLEWFTLLPFTPYPATNTDLGYECGPFVLNHGFSFKVSIAYNRDWK
ncbi:MAG TPA: hypothetical protein PLO02_08605 [Tenuifilaceae bacterium]|jgi:hypothetical protein|nr:hypothetical protein [Bacteroidales bacterium]MDI9517004.1 hypothetical protein [Bacteroidota bacterium]NLH56102.1 hypothetical protein [Rikenellaceae bacterium]OQC61165.1 MAG: hypothetical protein BWX49_02438 [Bacteroidetes bacterium ADurb.Bin008]HNV81489.1 hypothetical protein [Tenuifilaceae bacterium]